MDQANNYSTAAFTHIGQRNENQDRYCVLTNPDNDLLVIVADGMGGHKGGSFASQAIIDAASQLWSKFNSRQPIEKFLNDLVTVCQAAVLDKGQEQELSPLSTLAALYIYHNQTKAISIHAGDSRIMQFSESEFITQTIDHSLAQLQVLQGKISQQEVASHPDQNKLISYIGGDTSPDAEITHWNLAKGKRFVVCSDGFWEIFSLADVLKLYQDSSSDAGSSNHSSLETAISKLFMEKLDELSQHDNTTVVMLELESQTAVLPGFLSKGNNMKIAASATLLVIVIAVLFSMLGSPDTDTDNSEAGSSALPASDVVQTQTGEMDTPPESANTGELGEMGPNANGDILAQGELDEIETEAVDLGGESGQRNSRILSPLEIETSIPIANDEELVTEVSDRLRNDNKIGTDDELKILREDSLGTTRVIRMKQYYKGVPIFGAEIITTEDAGKLTNISGSAAPEIILDTEPALDYIAAIDSARKTLNSVIETQEGDDGQLIIYSLDSVYHLAWIGMITVDALGEQIIIDAHDGNILARLPVRIGEV